MFSPDGHWIAYMSNELGANDVLVRPFPQKAGGPRRVSTGGGGWPFWSMTSHELLFVNANKVMVAPYSVAGDVFTPGQPQPWSPTGFEPAPLATLGPWALQPDGKRVLVAAGQTQGVAEVKDKVVFYSGFGEYLKKIAPVTK